MAIQVSLSEVTTEIRKHFDMLGARSVAQCASRAINKVLAQDRVLIAREIRSIYNMGVFDAKSEITQIPANTRTLTGMLMGNAGFTPIEYFKISGENNITGSTFKAKRKSRYTMVNGKRKVSGKFTSVSSPGEGRHATFEVSIVKGQSRLLTHAFIANSKNGPMLFNRGTYGSRTNVFSSISSRNPMARLRTLSVWQEMNNKRIVGKSAILLRVEYEREFFRLLTVAASGRGWR